MSATSYSIEPLVQAGTTGTESSDYAITALVSAFSSGQLIQVTSSDTTDVITSSAISGSPGSSISLAVGGQLVVTFNILSTKAGGKTLTLLSSIPTLPNPGPASYIVSGQVQVNFLVLNVQGNPQSGVTIYFEMTGINDSRVGLSYPGVPLAAISNNSGLISISLPTNSTFQIWRAGQNQSNIPFSTGVSTPEFPVTLIGGN